MKIVEKTDATASLAEYAADIDSGPVVVTNMGQPVAVLLSIENADVETISLASNREFIELIARSRDCARTEGGVSSDEMRQRFK